MTDKEVLERAVLMYPHLDLPRLQYADFLETESDNVDDAAIGGSMLARCELIRLQCGMKDIPPCEERSAGQPNFRCYRNADIAGRAWCDPCVEFRVAEDRVRTLLTLVAWKDPPAAVYGWDRGFVSTMTIVSPQPDRNTPRSERIEFQWNLVKSLFWLFNKQPITRLVVDLAQPWQPPGNYGRHYTWANYAGDINDTEVLSVVPEWLVKHIDLVNPSDSTASRHIDPHKWWGFSTAQLAVDTLSDAIVSWGREQAGLPPLEVNQGEEP